MGDQAEPTHPCPSCDRKFTLESLQRHEPICRKQASKKRKVFDSGKQRSANSDIPLTSVRKVQEEVKKNEGRFKPPKTAWREHHEQFMSTVQSAKGVDYALKTGAPLPPPPKTKIPSDYVQCEYCGRHFNRHTAERHIPFCKEQHSRQTGGSKPMPAARNMAPAPSANRNNQHQQQQRRSQPMLATYGDQQQADRRYGGGGARGKVSSALTTSNSHHYGMNSTMSMGGGNQYQHDPYEQPDERMGGRSGYRQAGRNTRSISAGRVPAQNALSSAQQSRVPVPHRRGISPVTRIPAYTRTK